jgi:release factor glutamine methyltransferase
VLEVLRAATGYFEQREIDAPARSAELLMGRVLGLDRMQLYLAHDRPLSAEEKDRLRAFVARRGKGEPLAYILGDWEFLGHLIEVSPAVLIPRPETEGLVELVLEEAPEAGSCLDMGTGSAAIAIALAKARPELAITATDISQDALDQAAKNLERHELGERIALRLGSYWDALVPDARFDVLVCNPPYVDPAQPDLLAKDVRDHEPAVALFTPAGDPVAPLREILAAVPTFMNSGAQLFLETGVGAAEPSLALLEAAGFLLDVQLREDLAGVPRYLTARVRE